MITHNLEDIALYGYCSLRYKYRVVLGLPYRESSYQEAYAQTIRKSISRLLFAIPSRGATRAKEITRKVFESSWEAASKNMDWDHQIVSGLKIEGHLALYAFMGSIGADDTIIGGQMETDLSIGSDIVVRHSIDGLIMRNDSRAKRVLIIVHITREKSPLWAPKFQPLQFQWSLAVIRRQLDHEKRTMHWLFSPYADVSSKIYDGTADRKRFRELVKALVRGIENKVYLPTPHPERCKSCWYKAICDSSHCGDLSSEETNKIKQRLEHQKQ